MIFIDMYDHVASDCCKVLKQGPPEKLIDKSTLIVVRDMYFVCCNEYMFKY